MTAKAPKRGKRNRKVSTEKNHSIVITGTYDELKFLSELLDGSGGILFMDSPRSFRARKDYYRSLAEKVDEELEEIEEQEAE